MCGTIGVRVTLYVDAEHDNLDVVLFNARPIELDCHTSALHEHCVREC